MFSLLPPELTDTFVVYGCSAGGLATYTWVQTIADFIYSKNQNAKVIGLPDAGFFIDYPSLITGTNDYARNIKAVVDLVNSPAVPLPNARCMANETAEPHHCLMAEHLLSYIDVPLFISESLYDIWQLANILQVPCMDNHIWPPGPISLCNSSELVEINKFKDYTIERLQYAFDMKPSSRGVWAPACPYHCYSRFGLATDPDSSNYTVPALSEHTLGQASHSFLFEGDRTARIDTVNWPANSKCATFYQLGCPKPYSMEDQYSYYSL